MTLPIKVPPAFHIIAHRGASAYAPENTSPAFRLAHEIGVDEVETDAQLSVDGQVVLCHDRELGRYGHGPTVVEEMAWSALSRLDMGSWFSPYLYGGERMLRLDDLFATYGDRFTYHVELKGRSEELAQAVYECLGRHNLRNACVVTSFSYESLRAMRAAGGNLPLAWLVEEVTQEVLDRARTLDLYQVCPRAANVTAAQVAIAREVVSEVRAWGVSGSRQEVLEHIQRVIDSGCDGATINWPDWLSV